MGFIKWILVVTSASLVCGCHHQNTSADFQKQHYFYSNIQGNNTIEGEHIFIKTIKKDTIVFYNEIGDLLNSINKRWILGQGSGKPYYDTGKEYLWRIKEVIAEKKSIIVHQPKSIQLDLPVVFWKSRPLPVLFSNTLQSSWGFSKINYNPTDSNYSTHLYQCDTATTDIYLATSKNGLEWNIKPILTPKDFGSIKWNFSDDGTLKTSPLISDIIQYQGTYYSFVYGDDAEKHTYIGLLTSDALEGKYTIHEHPIIAPRKESQYACHDVYHPKVIQIDSSWFMFYTGKNNQQEEFICVAQSKDLLNWTNLKENIIPRNKGWNSAMFNQLCAQVKLNQDTLMIWVTGAKNVGDYDSPNKGNAMDACIGKFFTVLPELNFKEFPGNPVFGGNPIYKVENDHIGAAFQEIDIDGYKTTFYHGKGISSKNYTLLIQ